MLTACHFSAFDDERFHPGFYWDPDVPLVDFRAGTLMMSSILFKDLETTPKHHIRIGEDVVSAQLFAVRTPDAPVRIKDESNGALIVLGE